MSTGAIIVVIVVAAVIVVALAWLASMQVQRRRLRERFGSEYDRTVESADNRRAAERELSERERRHSEYEIKPLAPAERERYTRQWMLIQEQFVDQPGRAVVEADRLVTVVMGECGYPTEGYQQQVSDLSVRHSSTLDHYRTAHGIKDRHEEAKASTEELREAMMHYRTLFQDLVESDVDGRTKSAGNGNGRSAS
jgi:hypothetical protein